MQDLHRYIRDIPDFPKKGIVFKDITPLLGHFGSTTQAVAQMTAPFKNKAVQLVVGIESRGFIFGSLAAQKLGAGFVPVRKPGKLPHKTIRQEYSLEYGKDAVEMHADAVAKGQKVLMVDDLLATGGTMDAACSLVRQLGGEIVGIAFLIELEALKGRQKLPPGIEVHSVIQVK
ncbi:MAG: adenine phosphoribosyltransferase [Planctomycetes bacterium]|nr:adenine phosphoribosyltransferase [Planctomycetota bacterium]